MLKRFLKYSLSFCFLLIFNYSFSQVYGNEWIVAGQRYFRIPVAQNGMYALTYNDLVSAGVPLSSIDCRKIQLFHRGQEQAIRIIGEEDTHFDQNDSLIFYGIRNNGELDSLLYDPYHSQPHKYFSLYSDTTAYFLTISNSSNGKRMQEVNGVYAGSPAPYHLEELLNVYTEEYDRGRNYSIETAKSSWDYGEGWTGRVRYKGETVEYVLPVSNYLSSGPLPRLEILFSGRNDLNHNVQVVLGSDASSSPYVYSVNGFSNHTNKKLEVDVPSPAISSGQLKVTVTVLGVGLSADAVSVAYIKLVYPQLTDMAGRSEAVLNVLPSSSYISLSGIYSVPSMPVVYDILDRNNLKLVHGQLSGSSLQLPGSGPSGANYLITGVSNYKNVIKIAEVDLSSYPLNLDYLIITHRQLWAKANEYASYRQSAEGGGHKPLVADVLKLYDMFTYGEKTSLAIRRFLSYYIDKGSPEYALIIGKGLDPAHSANGVYYRLNPVPSRMNENAAERVDDLVPPGGSPGSDWIYVTGLGSKNKNIPRIPIGRIPARTNEQVASYLNKVKEHENASTNPNALWRKRIIHLSGGNNPSQVTTFRDYLTGFKQIAEGAYWGGKVKSFVKNSTNPTEFINLSSEVNDGVGLITFFGHSSSTYSDVDIGFVSMNVYGYNNKGKYPMILMNGCASSNIYFGNSFAEDWTLTPNKGAVVFIGHSDAGYPVELRRYSDLIYKKMFTDTLGMHRPLGQIQRDVIETYLGSNTQEVAVANADQMLLVGDPAIRVYAPGFSQHGKTTTDYAINSSGLFLKSFNSERITAISDSFAIGIPVSNLGITNSDTFSVCLRRTIGTKVMNENPAYYAPISFEDTIYYIVRTNGPDTYGLNTFEITLDCENAIPEADDYINNKASLDYFIPLSAVTCLYPAEFSVVNKQPVTFIAQTTDLLEEEADYYIELDTSWKFNSPFKKAAIVHSGSLIKWPDIKLLDTVPSNDSIVYYWRIRKAQAQEEEQLWGTSSFIYIHNSPEGWSQSEYPQFLKDDGVSSVIDTVGGTFKFSDQKTRIIIHTAGPDFYPPVNTEYPNLSDQQFVQTIINTNGIPWVYNGRGGCQTDAVVGRMLGLAFDRISSNFYVASRAVNLCGRAERVLAALQEPEYATYINSVKHGDYILLVSHGRVAYETWSEATRNLFKDVLGAKLIDSLKDNDAYILLTKKGHSTPIYERFSSTQLDLDTVLLGTNYKGTVTSTLIGPADEWGSLFYNVKRETNDNFELKIIRFNLNGEADTLNIPQQDSLDLRTLIDADLYPYIKLYAELLDSVDLTPPDLKKWQVIYSPVPEGTISPLAGKLEQYKVKKKHEGEPFNLEFEFTNITNIAFRDSLKVKYTLRNVTTGNVDTSLVNLGKLDALASVRFNFEIKTAGFSGNNIFQAYVNPRLQKEQYYNNNILEVSFEAEGDKTNPLLDVLFDGVHIMDGDLVSPSPLINIIINDENKYLFKTDSVGISIFLQRPGQNPEPIYFSNPDILRWGQTGSARSNTFGIDYNPKNLPDGTYKLIVQGADASNNKSGKEFYEITFTVENASTISHFYPYPNPFSTSTRFVFTLTGAYIPEDLKIQIMTVTGKVVREITKAELGAIRIGHNISDYAWDGTDEFGDKLANGVYLYRVVIKNAGDNFKQRATGGDKAFKKDFGKLYILR